jgi:nicotinamidase-related amidase
LTEYVDHVTVVNPLNTKEQYESLVWPVHCVQNTPGAALIPELDQSKLDKIIEKGTDPRVEMYSAFYPPLTNPRMSDSGLAETLRESRVTHVYVVGLASDYCVKSTAIDAAKEGFTTYIVEEGTRAVDPAGWAEGRKVVEDAGVKIVSMDGPEIARLK